MRARPKERTPFQHERRVGPWRSLDAWLRSFWREEGEGKPGLASLVRSGGAVHFPGGEPIGQERNGSSSARDDASKSYRLPLYSSASRGIRRRDTQRCSSVPLVVAVSSVLDEPWRAGALVLKVGRAHRMYLYSASARWFGAQHTRASEYNRRHENQAPSRNLLLRTPVIRAA